MNIVPRIQNWHADPIVCFLRESTHLRDGRKDATLLIYLGLNVAFFSLLPLIFFYKLEIW